MQVRHLLPCRLQLDAHASHLPLEHAYVTLMLPILACKVFVCNAQIFKLELPRLQSLCQHAVAGLQLAQLFARDVHILCRLAELAGHQLILLDHHCQVL